MLRILCFGLTAITCIRLFASAEQNVDCTSTLTIPLTFKSKEDMKHALRHNHEIKRIFECYMKCHKDESSSVSTKITVDDSNVCHGHSHGDLYLPEDGCFPYFHQCVHDNGDCNGHSHGDHYVDDDNGCYFFFYHCVHGTPVQMNCTGGLIFDPSDSLCQGPESVPECFPASDGCHGHSHGDLYSSEKKCFSYFYQCVHGKAYKMPCPKGLVFDTTLDVCNWPSEVKGCEEGVLQTRPICEGLDLNIYCPEGRVIRIVDANYGRNDSYTGLYSLDIAQEAVNMKMQSFIPGLLHGGWASTRTSKPESII